MARGSAGLAVSVSGALDAEESRVATTATRARLQRETLVRRIVRGNDSDGGGLALESFTLTQREVGICWDSGRGRVGSSAAGSKC